MVDTGILLNNMRYPLPECFYDIFKLDQCNDFQTHPILPTMYDLDTDLDLF